METDTVLFPRSGLLTLAMDLDLPTMELLQLGNVNEPGNGRKCSNFGVVQESYIPL